MEPSDADAPDPDASSPNLPPRGTVKRHAKAITKHANALLNGSKATPKEQAAQAAEIAHRRWSALRERCLAQFRIAPDELDKLRFGGPDLGERGYRCLQRLSQQLPWDRARPLLLAAREARLGTTHKGVKATVSVTNADVLKVLDDLGRIGGPLLEESIDPPAVVGASVDEGQPDCENPRDEQDPSDHHEPFDDSSNEFQPADDTYSPEPPSPSSPPEADDFAPRSPEVDQFALGSPTERAEDSVQDPDTGRANPDTGRMNPDTGRENTEDSLLIRRPDHDAPPPSVRHSEDSRRNGLVGHSTNDQDSTFNSMDTVQSLGAPPSGLLPQPTPSFSASGYQVEQENESDIEQGRKHKSFFGQGADSLSRPARPGHQQDFEDRSFLSPNTSRQAYMVNSPASPNQHVSRKRSLSLTGFADHPHISTNRTGVKKRARTQPTHECLSEPEAWLTGQCIVDLLYVVSAGRPESICIADTSCSVGPRMLRGGGCLEAATTSATVILLPLHLGGNHWALAVLSLKEGGLIELFDSLPSLARTENAEKLVREFLSQLVDAWPHEIHRQLPAAWKTRRPRLVSMAGPTQNNNFDCGVAIVVVAMHVIAEQRLPRTCCFGMWRKLFCSLLPGEGVRFALTPTDISPLLTVPGTDYKKIRPGAKIVTNVPGLAPEPTTVDDLEQHILRLQQHAAAVKAEQRRAVRMLEETLVDMDIVVTALFEQVSRASSELALLDTLQREMPRAYRADRASSAVTGVKAALDIIRLGLADKIIQQLGEKG
ncbi:hypothetical protein QBC39DRAFT_364650 [Podospora conica]|nr:hypothetical protein QBC39DRAFT_364650 [Schizothecium conicum]